MAQTQIDQKLKEIYYNPENPGAFSSVRKLYNEAKQFLPTLNYKNVVDWLSTQLTYTLHKAARKNFIRNRIIVRHVDEQWQADLVDLQEFSRKNKGFKYILTVIDCLSKYAWVVPLKTKQGQEITKAFVQIFKQGRMCAKLQTDQGKEFLNSQLQNTLKDNQIQFFTSNKNSSIKCAIAERFNRTLKEKMFKFFTASGTRKYIDKLQDMVKSYNHSFHRSIKMKPANVTSANENEAFCNLYGTTEYRNLMKNHFSAIKKEDTVRRKYLPGPFEKGYYPKWTDQIFKIYKAQKGNIKPVYKLKAQDGTILSGTFYKEDIQPVKENLYRIEKILKKRKRNNRTEYFVKWLNYPAKYNSWVTAVTNVQDG